MMLISLLLMHSQLPETSKYFNECRLNKVIIKFKAGAQSYSALLLAAYKISLFLSFNNSMKWRVLLNVKQLQPNVQMTNNQKAPTQLPRSPSHSRSRSRDSTYTRTPLARYTIYALKLTGGKYYIGRTTKPVGQRFQEHLSGQLAAVWSRKHRPVKIIESMRSGSGLTELSVTKEYMARYGIENVRGSCYCRAELGGLEMDRLQLDIREIRAELDLCYYCGGNHYSYRCSKQAANTPSENCRYEINVGEVMSLGEVMKLANSGKHENLQGTKSKSSKKQDPKSSSSLKTPKQTSTIQTSCFTDLLEQTSPSSMSTPAPAT